MRMRGIPGLTSLALALQATTAAAYGLGVDERIAAVYDHEIAIQALEKKHNVAFFAIDGALSPRTRYAIEAIAESTFGVDKGSSRVSVETATLSFTFDPQRVALGAIQRILDERLAGIRLSLLPMRIIDA